MNELTEKDRQLLIKKGISEEILDAQIAQFKQGIPPIQLYKAAVIDEIRACLWCGYPYV